MRKVVSVTLLSVLVASCAKPVDLSGHYQVTDSPNCQGSVITPSLIDLTIQKSKNVEGEYSAILKSDELKQNNIPSLSFIKNGDSTYSIEFLKEGKTGFFKGKPTIKSSAKIVESDNTYIIVSELNLDLVSPVNNKTMMTLDFINDEKFEFQNKKEKNKYFPSVSDKTLCLKKSI